jgi:DNA polymerase-1
VSRLLIIDGHAYAYRAFHAIRELRGPDGQPTNAIFGFVKMLEKMRLALGPTHLIVVWDGGLSAGRLAALPAYKAQRPSMPDELRPQFDELDKYLSAAGIASFCHDGVEADDYIGCLAQHAAAAGCNVVIASSDKDFMQLVSDRIGLLNPNDKTGKIWGREEVCAKSGVEPGQVVDWLALMGDAVDNIPGVAGVGPKTAAELLKQFGSVKNLLERLGEVKSDRLRVVLANSMDVVRRNLELVRLMEVPCEFVPESLVVQPADREKLRGLYRHWGFNGMLAALETQPSEQQAELI